MFGLLEDTQQRHRVLTVLMAAAVLVYVTGAAEVVCGFDLAMLAALVGGCPIFYSAAAALVRGRLSADFAVSLAVLAAVYLGYRGGCAENMHLVAAEVVLVMLIGKALEHVAVNRTRGGIEALLALRPETARVRSGNREHFVPIDEIEPEDIVIVRPGDRIAVDGAVVAGSSAVDQSPIIGESLPANKTIGARVFAGTINLHGTIEVEAERVGRGTALDRIIRLVERAASGKAPSQRLADRCATWFVPIVLGIALVCYAISGDIILSVAILVVACPCALVLAAPTAIAAAIGALARQGVLVKEGTALEKLGRLRSVVFGKTGTLTLGRLRIARIVPAGGYGENDVLRLAAAVERHSDHPIGKLIAERAAAEGFHPVESKRFEAHPGLGAEAVVAGRRLRVGSPRLMELCQILLPDALRQQVDGLSAAGYGVVLVARDREAVGAVAVEDTVRPGAKAAVARLGELKIERIVMLTGDNPAAARPVAEELGIGEIRTDLMPDEKVAALRQIQKEAGPAAMVGDGINDAASLAAADVGIAIAKIGADGAIDSAEMVLVGDDLRRLPGAIALSRWMQKIVWQSILAFALVFNVLGVTAASLGWLSPLAGAVLHQACSLIVVLNSLRLAIDYRGWRLRVDDWRAGFARRRRRLFAAAALLLAAAYAATGFYVVGAGQMAVVQHFGEIVHAEEPPGLHYRLPYPLGRHGVVNLGETGRVEIGLLAVAGGTSLVDVKAVVEYRVADPVAALVRVGRQDIDGSNKWDRLVRAVAESALRAELAGRAGDEILGAARQAIERAAERRLAAEMLRYGSGLAITSIRLAGMQPPREVLPALREAAGAREEKRAQISQAEAYRSETESFAESEAAKRRLEAEGFGIEEKEKAAGAADRFLAMAEAHKLDRQVDRTRLYLETVEEILAGRRKIIVDRTAPGVRRQVRLGELWSLPLQPATRPANANSSPPEDRIR
jgi:heavy metal translocating P-type ATPase